MTRVLLVAALGLMVGCGGCGGSTPQADAGAHDGAAGDGQAAGDGAAGDAGLLPFGADCTDSAQCQSNVCFQFGQGEWCTLKCTDASQCPSGSQGQKCNLQGYCRP